MRHYRFAICDQVCALNTALRDQTGVKCVFSPTVQKHTQSDMLLFFFLMYTQGVTIGPDRPNYRSSLKHSPSHTA